MTMGAIWKFFSGEDDTGLFESSQASRPSPVQHQRTTLWGLFTGQHGDSGPIHHPGTGMSQWGIENEATAYHEAGHARAARKARMKVQGMWAFPDGSGLTKVDGAADIKAHLVAIIAGQESEIRYLMDKHGYTRRQAEKRTHHGAGGDRALFEQVAAGTRYTWDGLKGEAQRLVKWHAYTIETNARPLARRGLRGGTWA
jgi:hypothetical protein